MAKNERNNQTTTPEAVISIIGKGMTLTGDCETDGALRIEGTVHGNVRAGKAVVIGKEGVVDGNIYTQDAVISGLVLGSVHAQSRLELQSTSQISGEIEALRMQLEEGASVQGKVSVGEAQTDTKPAVSTPIRGDASEGEHGGQGAPGGLPSGGRPRVGVSVATASPAASASQTREASQAAPSPAVTVTRPGSAPSRPPPPGQGEGRSAHGPPSPPSPRPT